MKQIFVISAIFMASLVVLVPSVKATESLHSGHGNHGSSVAVTADSSNDQASPVSDSISWKGHFSGTELLPNDCQNGHCPSCFTSEKSLDMCSSCFMEEGPSPFGMVPSVISVKDQAAVKYLPEWKKDTSEPPSRQFYSSKPSASPPDLHSVLRL